MKFREQKSNQCHERSLAEETKLILCTNDNRRWYRGDQRKAMRQLGPMLRLITNLGHNKHDIE